MQEIKLKRLTLFLLESILLWGDATIDEGFASQFNFFIEKYYNDNKELFSLIYDTKLLENFLENDWEVLSFENMIELIKKYRGFKGYSNLVNEVDSEVRAKLIELAKLFNEYRKFLLDLYLADPSIYYPRAYAKSLNILIS